MGQQLCIFQIFLAIWLGRKGIALNILVIIVNPNLVPQSSTQEKWGIELFDCM